MRNLITIVGFGLLLLGCAGPETVESTLPTGKEGRFEVRHELKVMVPDGSQRVRVWFAVPQDDAYQDIVEERIESPIPTSFGRDSEGNRVLYAETAGTSAKEFTIVHHFTLARREVLSNIDASQARPLTAAERASLAKYTTPNQHVLIDDRIRTIAREVVASESNTVKAARRLYDWELDNIDYWVKDPNNRKASPVGSTEHCLTTKSGNCTDFHSLWASLARAESIPTRIIYGVFLKKELDGQDVDSSYHCWPEFYVGGVGWVPHDVAVADIYHDTFGLNADNETLVRRTTADGYSGPDRRRVDYYFGNIDERRVVFSSGRDLAFDPPCEVGPVNALAKAYVEVDGKVHPEKTGWTRKLTYRELANRQ